MTHIIDAPSTFSTDRLEHVGPARFVDSSPWPRVTPPEGDELNLVTEMTDAELADALRPVILRDGHEYTVESHPEGFLPRLRSATGAIGDNSKPNFGRRMTRDVFDFIVEYSAL